MAGTPSENFVPDEPVAWRVTHYQDGTKPSKVSVSLHADKAKAEYVFWAYGTAAEGIKGGSIEPLYLRPERTK